MGICGVAQKLLIDKAKARTPKQMSEIRRKLREHAKQCTYCQKMMRKRKQ